MTTKACRKKGRKHTPIVSKKQRGMMGVAYAAKKGKKIKGGLRGPAMAIKKGMTKAELKRHLKESKGKKLPSKVAKKKKKKLAKGRKGTRVVNRFGMKV